MIKISEKSKRWIFASIIALVFAYLLYIIISYYVSDRVGMVKLSYDTDKANIVNTVYATYNMNPGEGNLKLSRDREIELKSPKGALSEPIVLDSIGELVKEVQLELNYDDTLYDGDELRLVLVKLQNDGSFKKHDCRLDIEKNTLISKVEGKGVWFLATPEALN